MKLWTKYSLIILLLALIGGSSCARLDPAQKKESGLTEQDRFQHFDQDKYRTFNTIMQVLKNQGYNLETRDSNEGLIFTDYQLASAVGAPFDGNPQVKVEVVLKEQDQGTEVMLTLRIQQEIALIGSQSTGVTQQEAKRYYEDLFRIITTQIEE